MFFMRLLENTMALGNFEISLLLAGWESCFLPRMNLAPLSNSKSRERW